MIKSTNKQHKAIKDSKPYIPSGIFLGGAKQCKCGCHEGYHNQAGECINHEKCGCGDFSPPHNIG